MRKRHFHIRTYMCIIESPFFFFFAFRVFEHVYNFRQRPALHLISPTQYMMCTIRYVHILFNHSLSLSLGTYKNYKMADGLSSLLACFFVIAIWIGYVQNKWNFLYSHVMYYVYFLFTFYSLKE